MNKITNAFTKKTIIVKNCFLNFFRRKRASTIVEKIQTNFSNSENNTNKNHLKKSEKINKNNLKLKKALQLYETAVKTANTQLFLEARELCDQVIKFDCKCAKAYKTRGKIWLEIARTKKMSLRRKKGFENALEDLQKSAKLDETDLYVDLEISKVYLLDKKREKAIEVIDRILNNIEKSKYKDDKQLFSKVYCELGNFYASGLEDCKIKRKKNRRFEKAVQAYNKSLEYDHTKSNIYKRLAMLYYKNNDYELSIEYFQEAIYRGMKRADTYAQLSAIYYRYAQEIFEQNKECFLKNQEFDIQKGIWLLEKAQINANKSLDINPQDKTATWVKNSLNGKIRTYKRLMLNSDDKQIKQLREPLYSS